MGRGGIFHQRLELLARIRQGNAVLVQEVLCYENREIPGSASNSDYDFSLGLALSKKPESFSDIT